MSTESNRNLAYLTKRLPSLVGRNPKQSVWVEFVEMAMATKAVNLGQGFPDSPMPSFMAKHMQDVAACPERTDWHQYTRGYGHMRLVNAISKLYSRLLGVQVNPQTDILITVGAYLSLYYSFIGWLNPGDEVIIFEPAYDSYVSQIEMAGGVPVPVVMTLDPKKSDTSAGYTLDFDEVRRKINSKTKMIVLNNPNNPTGKLYTRQELETIASIAEQNDLLVLTDEVYEWHVYPGKEMIRFGKCFSATGWKVGWSIGPAKILEPLKKVHENCIFAQNTPIQEAVARAFEQETSLIESGRIEESYLMTGLAKELLPKRDIIAEYLKTAGFNPIIPDAGYFIIADFEHLEGPFQPEDETGATLDYRFVRWLCKEKKLASIPPSAFYSPGNRKENDHFVRLCFFKKDETLNAAIDILKGFFQK
ncbi:aminotransferase class I and II domain-containing protein [Ditylenchus destructor]|uniref:Aminotransferase class I and II domain-containing protein n=1 Tax=Ditylenchus destructor TaxID=166010 RepID=A0AAD4QTJ0_9BILA|nr:aminotransferase class I and II domain-containing protein [Ditylenchus destructor]